MNRFTDLHMCDFTLTERDQQLQSIAEQYVRETEAYDRSVCTGPIRYGEITPATPQDFLLVNRNAKQLLDTHPDRVIRRAVWGMLPKGALGRKLIKKLKIYSGSKHEHGAQRPRELTV